MYRPIITFFSFLFFFYFCFFFFSFFLTFSVSSLCYVSFFFLLLSRFSVISRFCITNIIVRVWRTCIYGRSKSAILFPFVGISEVKIFLIDASTSARDFTLYGSIFVPTMEYTQHCQITFPVYSGHTCPYVMLVLM